QTCALPIWYAYQQGAAANTLADAQFEDARQQFFHRVASSYFNVLKAWENLTSANAEKKAIGEQLDQTRERFEVGLIAITDVHEAEAAYDLVDAIVIMAEAEFDIARDKFLALIGRSSITIATIHC